MFFLNKIQRSNWPRIILRVLLIVDLLFIVIHILIAKFNNFNPDSLLLDAKGFGYPECFQYLKYLVIMGIVAYLFFLKKWYFYKLMFLLFAGFLVDDFFQLHYLASSVLSNLFYSYSEYNYVALGVGQLIYSLIIILFFLSLALLFYRLTSNQEKAEFLNIFMLLCFFLFFGLGVDLLHMFFKEHGSASLLLTIIEEGGEMFTLSTLVWYFYSSVVKYKVYQFSIPKANRVNKQ
ncbi:hypothetical protein JCM19302_983 [Jejuia pallidilutea]|uniref:Uncharacterized protein n=2 Tax=Jejuia pallidilutea TaxID=504487 RepID=A0A090W2Y4_9FLAO|nr:hypothetical protein JCM19302_983 [Jejuia pallidilutea]GAL88720.1 hypothetical protein JCM19538_1155 [Jejuia pallidilutea]